MSIRCFLLWLLIPFKALSQSPADDRNMLLFINPSVINKDDYEVKKVLDTFRDYLYTKDSLYQSNPYWSTNEYRRRNIPDYFFKRINHSVIFNKKYFYKPTVLSVQKLDSSYIIRTLFANGEKDNGFSRVSGIINVEAIKENDNWKLKSLLDRNLREKYKSVKIGMINYFLPNERKLDTSLAASFDRENKKIATLFGVYPVSITYYLCADNSEIQRLVGFDYEFSMAFPNQIGGLADVVNNAIYAGNNSEWYPHELVHLYTNKVYGTNINESINEGLATYLGGSVGKPLQYHLHKTATYIKTHKVDFNRLSTLERIDDETNFQYTIGGLLCKLVTDKAGFEGIGKLLRTNDNDSDLLKVVELIFKVKPVDFNNFIINELRKYE